MSMSAQAIQEGLVLALCWSRPCHRTNYHIPTSLLGDSEDPWRQVRRICSEMKIAGIL